MISFSNFGVRTAIRRPIRVRDAVAGSCDQRHRSPIDGEMQADTAVLPR